MSSVTKFNYNIRLLCKPNFLPNIHAQFFSNNDYIRAINDIPITGTQKNHCAIPNGEDTLGFNECSSSLESRIYKIFKRVRN